MLQPDASTSYKVLAFTFGERQIIRWLKKKVVMIEMKVLGFESRGMSRNFEQKKKIQIIIAMSNVFDSED